MNKEKGRYFMDEIGPTSARTEFGYVFASTHAIYKLVIHFPKPQHQPFHDIRLMNHTLPNLTPPPLRSLKSIRMCLEILQSLVDFVLCIEDKWPVLDDFLIERQASNEDY